MKVARKLGISAAPAMTGWDFKKGNSVPLIDGVVVCTENVEVLVAVRSPSDLSGRSFQSYLSRCHRVRASFFLTATTAGV